VGNVVRMGRGPVELRPDRSAVLERARAGSAADFEALYAELARSVAGYLRVSGVPDVEGMTNEVFADVYRGLPGFKGDWAGFRSWVFTIAHHRIVDGARRAHRRPTLVLNEFSDDVPVGVGDVEAEALDMLSDQRVQLLLEQLSADQQAVLLLRIVADLPLEDVAIALDKTVGAVKSLQHRALAALRRALEVDEADDDG
jgi:RNA polymerase sigma factor (sigma-70 family)